MRPATISTTRLAAATLPCMRASSQSGGRRDATGASAPLSVSRHGWSRDAGTGSAGPLRQGSLSIYRRRAEARKRHDPAPRLGRSKRLAPLLPLPPLFRRRLVERLLAVSRRRSVGARAVAARIGRADLTGGVEGKRMSVGVDIGG